MPLRTDYLLHDFRKLINIVHLHDSQSRTGGESGGKYMKMFLISDNVDTYTGMRLAGVDGVVVHERDELRKALEDVLTDKNVGIVLLTEKFGREFPDIIDTFRLERKMPLLVEIPDRHGTGRKKDFITSYITEAIGLKL